MSTSLPSPTVRSLRHTVDVKLATVLMERLLQKVLQWPARWLIAGNSVDTDPVDLVFLLAGNVETRAPMAAELFLSGVGKRIVFAQPFESEAVRAGLVPGSKTVTLKVLEAAGVSRDKIEVLCSEPVSSTRDEARALAQHLQQRPGTKVLVVTSAFHSRRAHWLVRAELKRKECSTQIVPVPHTNFDASNWWKSEHGASTLVLEYASWMHNLAWVAFNKLTGK